MKLCKQDLLVNIFKSVEWIVDVYCQRKDKADFLNLQGKLEPPTLPGDFGGNAHRGTRQDSMQSFGCPSHSKLT